jgi:DNA replication protein DnaC
VGALHGKRAKEGVFITTGTFSTEGLDYVKNIESKVVLIDIGQGYRVIYREAHNLLEEIAEAALDGNRKEHMELLTTVPLLIIDDLGMRKLGPTAGEELLEIVMRRYERASTLLTSNRPVEDWGKLLGDSAAVTAMLDRLLHHGHILKCGPRSWRTKTDLPDQEKAG